jgi:hypothetical protein
MHNFFAALGRAPGVGTIIAAATLIVVALSGAVVISSLRQRHPARTEAIGGSAVKLLKGSRSLRCRKQTDSRRPCLVTGEDDPLRTPRSELIGPAVRRTQRSSSQERTGIPFATSRYSGLRAGKLRRLRQDRRYCQISALYRNCSAVTLGQTLQSDPAVFS